MTWKNLTVELRTSAAATFVVESSIDKYVFPLELLPSGIERYALRLGIVFGNPYDSADVRMHMRFDDIRCDPAR